VLDSSGAAVALNAGCRANTATAYYLPLWAVSRALRLLRAAHALALAPESGAAERQDVRALWGMPCSAASAEKPLGALLAAAVPRGTLMTTLIHKAFHEVSRLGLSKSTEAAVRASFVADRANLEANSGMLVVELPVPGGSAHVPLSSGADGGADGDEEAAAFSSSQPGADGLQPGDALVRVGGTIVTEFRSLERILDGAVGGALTLQVERGGELLERVVQVRSPTVDVAVARSAPLLLLLLPLLFLLMLTPVALHTRLRTCTARR